MTPSPLCIVKIFLLATLVAGCSRPTISKKTASASPTPQAELMSAINSSAAGASKIIQPVWTGHGNLRDYYLHGKYPQAELDAVADMIDKVFPERSDTQKRQMVAEILSFHHVIYHPTENHDLARNHHTIGKQKALLEKMCARHNVPFYPVFAITSWENSGGVDKVSWADAAGLGQMTWGAVDEAHRYAARKAIDLKEAAQWEKYQGGIDKDPKRLEKAAKLELMASRLNVEQRHRKMAKDAGVSDERSIPECNLEDVVLFFDYLLSNYGGRADHAIGAYHKGVLNQDDILYDYLRRRDPSVLYPQPADRSSFLNAIERLNVSYLDVWNDPRSREMLNGLRTVEGEKTTRANKHLALGDEADIYPWKVLGSLSGVLASEGYLEKTVERYSVPQLAGEVRGLPAFLGEEGRKKGADQGDLVKAPVQVHKAEPKHERDLWARPELMGYLSHLQDRVDRLNGRPKKLPIVSMGEADSESPAWERELHSKGVAVKFSMADLTAEERKNLESEIQRDYLFDRIYLRSSRDDRHVVVNPRFGHEFMKLYEANTGVRRARSDT